MNHATKALPALLALACAGCISVLPEPKDAAPRYDVALPEVPATAAAAPEAAPAPARILVVGKVRAAEEASGREIRTADLETGRTGRLSDGELALAPEAIVGAFLRARLSAAHPGAIVCDASVAPHAGDGPVPAGDRARLGVAHPGTCLHGDDEGVRQALHGDDARGYELCLQWHRSRRAGILGGRRGSDGQTLRTSLTTGVMPIFARTPTALPAGSCGATPRMGIKGCWAERRGCS